MSTYYGSPIVVSDALYLTAAAVWGLILIGAVCRFCQRPSRILGELRDPILCPFWGLAPIVGMLLTGGLARYAFEPAKFLFLVFLVATILLAGWLSGDWIVRDFDRRRFHPGYYLPAVAGGLIGGQEAATFGLRGLGWLSFGIGIFCWLPLAAVVLGRLLFDQLPASVILPTVAIELAPPAVAGNAYFVLHGPVPDPFLYALAGYAVFMGIVQLRLVAEYTHVSFAPSFWAFVFPWAAAASFGIRWLVVEHPSDQAVYAGLIISAASLLLAAITTRSLVALARGEFLPSAIPMPRAEPVAVD
jgi:tellurite resistance protein